MAHNVENLKPMNQRTKEEQSRIARAGGIASGKARRERKTLKEELLLMLSDEKVQEQVTAALIQKAIKGDVKAFEVLRDTIGEKQSEKIESTNKVVDMSKFTTEQIKEMLDENI